VSPEGFFYMNSSISSSMNAHNFDYCFPFNLCSASITSAIGYRAIFNIADFFLSRARILWSFFRLMNLELVQYWLIGISSYYLSLAFSYDATLLMIGNLWAPRSSLPLNRNDSIIKLNWCMIFGWDLNFQVLIKQGCLMFKLSFFTSFARILNVSRNEIVSQRQRKYILHTNGTLATTAGNGILVLVNSIFLFWLKEQMWRTFLECYWDLYTSQQDPEFRINWW